MKFLNLDLYQSLHLTSISLATGLVILGCDKTQREEVARIEKQFKDGKYHKAKFSETDYLKINFLFYRSGI